MKNFLLTTCLFLSLAVISDEGVAGLLALSEAVWKEIEANPDNEEKWMEVAVLADMAANYSEIYDVWCKDMIAQRMKMRMMAEKKKLKKDKKD